MNRPYGACLSAHILPLHCSLFLKQAVGDRVYGCAGVMGVHKKREDEGILPYGRHSALFPYSLLHIPSNRRGRCPHRPANVHAEQTVEKVNRPYGCADKIGLLTFTRIYMYAGLYFTILFRHRWRLRGQNSPQCYSKGR